jgi:hypothetical protein
MIDSSKVTNFKRTTAELEELLLFSVAVAGKTAKIVEKQLEYFLSLERRGMTPFAKIRNMVQDKILLKNLKKSKIGKYSMLTKAYKELAFANIDLHKCEVKDLERFTGIGPKTSRFFILHTRQTARVAVLDTHILKWMSTFMPNVPKSTPSKKKYLQLEQQFLDYCDTANIEPAKLDLIIWNEKSRKVQI